MQAPTQNIPIKLTRKQTLALTYLFDSESTEILFGGAAGGGKSYLGVTYGIMMSLKYAGIRGFFAREELKSLKESTLLTFFDTARKMGLKEGVHYKYKTDSHITFMATGSTIYLKELKYYPSDQDYDYLGSTEYTWGFIDEASQITAKAKNIMMSRIRYKLNKYNLKPKLLMSTNPHKGYLYSEFYKPAKDGTLPKHKKFVKALPNDNPLLPESYIAALHGLDKQTKERLLYGNWEYDDDPTILCDINAINDLFTNIVAPSDKKYIICDVARKNDHIVITYWEGWACKRIAAYKKMPLVPDQNNPGIKNLSDTVEEWRRLYRVPLSNVLLDEDGMGGGPVDRLGCRGFIAQKPATYGNYASIKAQCTFHLAKKVNARECSVSTTNVKIKEYIIEELEQIKQHNADKDGKLQATPKELIKKKIGRSPDFSDTLMMRSYFDVIPQPFIRSITL